MPFVFRPYRRLSVCCPMIYDTGPFQGHGIVGNLSSCGSRLSGGLPMCPGESLSLTVTFPNAQRIHIPKAVVRWPRGQEFAVETDSIERQAQDRLGHFVRRLVLKRLS